MNPIPFLKDEQGKALAPPSEILIKLRNNRPYENTSFDPDTPARSFVKPISFQKGSSILAERYLKKTFFYIYLNLNS